MSTELTPVEVGEVEIIRTLAESEAKIRALVKHVDRVQRKAVDGMELAQAETERCDVEIGREFLVIKSAKTYKDRSSTWGAYLDDACSRLGIGDRRAQQLMRSVAKNEGNDFPSEIAPRNTEQRLEIASVPEEQREVVLAVTVAAEGKLTGRGIRETAERIAAGETPEQIIQPTSRDLLVAWAGELRDYEDTVWVGDNVSVADVKRWVREVV